MLSTLARRMPLEHGLDLAAIASDCDGYSAADLESLARTAAMNAFRDRPDAPIVTRAHFDAARAMVPPSVDEKQLHALRRFAAERVPG
jgi:transitional endoplasmic reticulum ATPase